MKKEWRIFVFFILFLNSFSLAENIADNIPIQIQVLNSSGSPTTGTFTFKIDISNSSLCSPILYTNTATKTTDSRGIVSYDLSNVNLLFNEQYWFCYYRDGVLKSVVKASRVPYAFNAKSVDLSGVNANANFDMGSYNLSANKLTVSGNQICNESVCFTLQELNSSGGVGDYSALSNSSYYWDGVDTYNSTQMENNNGILNILTSWLENLFYLKDEIFNKSDILGFNYYNLSNFNIADYYLSSNPFGFYNSTTLPSAGEETDPLWTGNQSSYFNKSDILGFNYYNLSNFNIADYYLSSNPFGFYNSTTLPPGSGDNTSWNESYADEKYVPYINSNKNVNLGIYNLTANWINGFFNWVSGDSYNIFNGSVLNFNETKLNETIALEGVRLGFNVSTGESLWANVSNVATYNGGLNVNNTLFVNSTTGRVGIGTTSPGTALDVNGDIRSSGKTYLGTSGFYSQYEYKTSATVAGAGWYRVAVIEGGAGRGQQQVTIWVTGGSYTPRSSTFRWHHSWSSGQGGVSTISEYGTGYWTGVRVTDDGASGPSYLEVYFTQALTSNLFIGLQYIGGHDAGTIYNGSLPEGGGTVAMTTNSNGFAFNDDFVVTPGGRVGIGTTSPGTALDVNGSINIADGNYYKYAGQNALVLSKGSIDTVYSNTIVGAGAGNTSSYRQTALGYYAGYNNSGNYQTALGVFAGYNNSGNYQTALGYSAGESNTGIAQTALGYSAGESNTGNYQTALGYQAGYNNSGNYQTALGYQAGYNNSGNYQTALGYYAGQFNEGYSQTALGYYAGYNNTGIIQTALGFHAGDSNTGNYTIAIGYKAGDHNSGNNVVAIGYQAGKSNTASDQFILQQANVNSVPLIQGDFASGNVGIGSTAPASKLSIGGNGISGAGLYVSGYTYGIYTDNSSSTNYFAGNVGIGTTSPSAALHVEGGPVYIRYDSNTNYSLKVRNAGGQAYGVEISGGANSATPLLNVHSGYTGGDDITGLYVRSDGKVGIGTTSPSVTLHVNGSIRGDQSGALRIDSGNGYVDVGAKNTGYAHFYTDRPTYYFNAGIKVDTGAIGSYDENLLLQTGGTTRATITTSGDLDVTANAWGSASGYDYLASYDSDTSSWGRSTSCPGGQYVCGMRTYSYGGSVIYIALRCCKL